MLGSGPVNYVVRHSALRSSVRVIRPFARKAEPFVDEDPVPTIGQTEIDAHLAVIHPTDYPAILVLYPDGSMPGLEESRAINMERRGLEIADETVSITLKLVDHISLVPRGVGDEVLDTLVVRTGNGLADAGHVPFLCDEKTVQIVYGMAGHRARLSAEEGGVTIVDPKHQFRKTMQLFELGGVALKGRRGRRRDCNRRRRQRIKCFYGLS